MNTSKKLLATAVAAAGLASTPAMAGKMGEVPGLDASVGASNIYLFRGVDVSSGSAHVYGDVSVRHEHSGLYASVWAGSDDGQGNGGEINLIGGWSAEFEGFGIDVGLVNYYFPGNPVADNFGDVSEAYIGASFEGLSFYWYRNIAGDNGVRDFVFNNSANFYELGYKRGRWSATLGHVDGRDSGESFDTDYTYIDLGYAVNENLNFTVSKVVDVDDELNPDSSSAHARAFVDDDVKFVVNYALYF